MTRSQSSQRQIDGFLAEIKSKQSLGSVPEEDVDASTNVFLSGLAPSINESVLQEVFSKYGRVESVKVLWPRTEEERPRHVNNGFVNYFTRSDASKAIVSLNCEDSTASNHLLTRRNRTTWCFMVIALVPAGESL